MEQTYDDVRRIVKELNDKASIYLERDKKKQTPFYPKPSLVVDNVGFIEFISNDNSVTIYTGSAHFHFDGDEAATCTVKKGGSYTNLSGEKITHNNILCEAKK
jgi:hypothetical protein